MFVKYSAAGKRVLGIDPGTAATGFGIIDVDDRRRMWPVWYDCLRTTPSEPMPERLVRIKRAVEDVIENMSPDVMAIEDLFFGASAKAALAVGQARGVCIASCASLGLPVFEYTNSAVKQAVTGFGRADKQQVMEMVRIQLGMSEVPRPDHAADALAIAMTHVTTSPLSVSHSYLECPISTSKSTL